jgi:hypothetical protein
MADRGGPRTPAVSTGGKTRRPGVDTIGRRVGVGSRSNTPS